MNKMNAFIIKDTLNISVDNLDELKLLIKNIEDKQKELDIAVENLSNYNLKITFQQLKDVE